MIRIDPNQKGLVVFVYDYATFIFVVLEYLIDDY